jgi:hypothetical protein
MVVEGPQLARLRRADIDWGSSPITSTRCRIYNVFPAQRLYFIGISQWRKRPTFEPLTGPQSSVHLTDLRGSGHREDALVTSNEPIQDLNQLLGRVLLDEVVRPFEHHMGLAGAGDALV